MARNETSRRVELSPSLICMDMCNLERDIHRLEALGCEVLHVDMIDGYFSPSMPIGLDTIRQLRKRTDLLFDAHVMAQDNAFFIDELINIGCHRICFQWESERSPGPLLQKIRAAGCEAGLALCPGTPVSVLEYYIEECDRILLMRIDPGYAHLPNQSPKPYMERKLRELRRLIEQSGRDVAIAVDGRVSVAEILPLYGDGVSTFVCGTSCLFQNGDGLEESWTRLKAMVAI